MANTVISKQARRAARQAASAAQDDVVRRTRANVEDLGRYFSARERLEAVDGWLAARQQVLREDAERRRDAQRVVCGQALAAMRDRRESLREIARMAKLSEKQARELIREAEAAASNATLPAADDAAVPTVADRVVGADEASEGLAVTTGDAIQSGAAVKPLAPSSALA
ncbi:hypothetical protein LIX17_18110 [Mycobacterium avium subsp. hominissuis]|uniref:Uncharacterized protein n=4 Tax=Mycobacterium TaxID=1763 RepID=A0A7G1IHB9_MYCKA|nr:MULTISPECIES: hypothetical protein [Mycobacterium]RUP06002.1 MAG: hypothetical protein EKK34_05915 [Mycobacterium sp.]ATQ40834.1 hypothetical protein KV38_25955 [Mycobacterium avium subsp. hominissuis]KZS85407.1 hypothetical protein A4G31_27490 [Mycobacterium persicum]MCA2338046.1 hypothetical protein [Mycobacterium avium]MCQ4365721.1 hypothetical protein [Mycobacterium gordonae]